MIVNGFQDFCRKLRTMNYYYFLLVFIPALAQAQYFQGFIQEDYTLKVKKINLPISQARSQPATFDQLEGFPKGFRADPNTKNFRNVTLEDIDNNGTTEILFSADNRLMAYSGNTKLWELGMTGIGIYPPSIADLDGDGEKEIVQVTGGNGRKGRVYLVDKNGGVLPGFPKNYADHWILTAPALSDVNGDGTMEIIFIEGLLPGGFIHIINKDGTNFSDNWPVRLPGTPAITPTIGDVDNDGEMEILVYSTTIMYLFDLEGQLEAGWPIVNPDTRFSFQSPILADLDGNQDLEIIGASHGNTPEYYILNHDATPYGVWPFLVPERRGTFNTPTVVKLDNIYNIFMSRPIGEAPKDMLYGWNEAGDLKEGLPIEKAGGLEGLISIADVENDGQMELIFGSNLIDTLGYGFIHAYEMDGGGELTGFPLRPRGWTLMNGAALGDVNNDGKMDLTALSYTTNFGNGIDSLFLNVYDLQIPYQPEKILWTTYKGNNTRNGNLETALISPTNDPILEEINIEINPNPIQSQGVIKIELEKQETITGQLYTITGQFLARLFKKSFSKGTHYVPITNLPAGIYLLKASNLQGKYLSTKIVVLKNR